MNIYCRKEILSGIEGSVMVKVHNKNKWISSESTNGSTVVEKCESDPFQAVLEITGFQLTLTWHLKNHLCSTAVNQYPNGVRHQNITA